MNFASDNTSSVSPRLLEAINRAASVAAARSYGNDDFSARAVQKISEIFNHEVAVFFVSTGTAANALSLSALCPPWGAILCHHGSHINVDESGAPEFFTGGAKLVGLPGNGGKINPNLLSEALKNYPNDPPHNNLPKVLSLTQATEMGLVYSPAEVSNLCRIAKQYNLAIHMDGARFANAIASVGCSPAEMTWKAGIDVLTLGATKDGALGAEAVVMFDPEKAKDFSIRIKRAGHLVSKSRWMGAQMEAWLEGHHWLDLARSANNRATELAESLAKVPGVRIIWKPAANLVFALLARGVHNRLQQAGAVYYEYPRQMLPEHEPLKEDEVFVRFACSFSTTREEVDSLVRSASATNACSNDRNQA